MMQRYLMNFSTLEMRTIYADCLVVGSGVAGLMAAWTAARAGRHVLLAVRDTLQDSNTSKAQGGIAAVFGADDAVSLHVADTLVTGAGLSNEAVVRIAVEEGRGDLQTLMDNGAQFDRLPDGRLALGREGCHSRCRIVHAQGDATGAEVARALLAMTAREPAIEVLEHCYVVDLLTQGGVCYGAAARHQGEAICLRADAVILATGGCGQLYRHTTNPDGATGSGIAMAYRAGAEVMDMEFVQFHPTALALDGCPNFLISEAVRGAGAVLRNRAGQRFMPALHAMAELAPRDVVARAIFQEMQQDGSSHVWLDATAVPEVAVKFPMIARTCQGFGLDIGRESIPIAPAAHYMMGGIRTDACGRTNLSGLYACGETACTGLQGANRLASNSLLEGLVFGRRAALAACALKAVPAREFSLAWSCTDLRPMAAGAEMAKMTAALQQVMSGQLGICREASGIAQAAAFMEKLSVQYEGTEAVSAPALDWQGRLLTSRLIARAAARRLESRGAHYRLDYPQTAESWQLHMADQAGQTARAVYDDEEEQTHGFHDVRAGRSAQRLA